jgi:hypothetical protein
MHTGWERTRPGKSSNDWKRALFGLPTIGSFLRGTLAKSKAAVRLPGRPLVLHQQRGLVAAMPATVPAVAATATTIAAALATPVATVAARRTVFTRLCFVHPHRAAVEVLVIQGGNGIQGFIAIRHFNKAEATGLAREFVHDHAGRTHLTIRGKSITKILIRGRIRQISYEYIHNQSILHSIRRVMFHRSPVEPATSNSGVMVKIDTNLPPVIKLFLGPAAGRSW